MIEYVATQVSLLAQWHAVQQECSRWGTHAVETICLLAPMPTNLCFGIHSIPQKRLTVSSQIMWSKKFSLSFFDDLPLVTTIYKTYLP